METRGRPPGPDGLARDLEDAMALLMDVQDEVDPLSVRIAQIGRRAPEYLAILDPAAMHVAQIRALLEGALERLRAARQRVAGRSEFGDDTEGGQE